MATKTILTHGGAATNPDWNDGTLKAAQAGMALLEQGQSALTAVVTAVEILENDARFNAGYSSAKRADHHTIQMDAACMQSDGKYGAVACVEGIANPIFLAQHILEHSPHLLLGGEDAKRFAKANGFELAPLLSMPQKDSPPTHPNQSCDTVGAVAYVGDQFAAALSSGGTALASVGRIGDVPLPGCGLYCGPSGAVACTGHGESIALKVLAKQVYDWLCAGMSPQLATERALALYPADIEVGLLVLNAKDGAAGAQPNMAWSSLTVTV